MYNEFVWEQIHGFKENEYPKFKEHYYLKKSLMTI